MSDNRVVPQMSAGRAEAEDPAQSQYMKQLACLYFGYGSNLSPVTMKQRCPDSLFISLGKLTGWRWQINETGYANIVPSAPSDEVWGTLCFLSRRDEKALDDSEGVPWLYEKKYLKVRRMPQPEAGEEWQEGDEIEVMTYVDVQRTTDGVIEKEYVSWIDKAIEDAARCGMPKAYSDKYLVPFLPTTERMKSDIMMVRTMQFGEKGADLVPRGFASWSRG